MALRRPDAVLVMRTMGQKSIKAARALRHREMESDHGSVKKTKGSPRGALINKIRFGVLPRHLLKYTSEVQQAFSVAEENVMPLKLGLRHAAGPPAHLVVGSHRDYKGVEHDVRITEAL